ncbi:uncharacterized protein C4orf17 homolog isoform X1 [Paroedura picta]|uniref:uncharacterized protein C4orf17 homolog isoform X1 n=1 Tax=Paroedura picta TaxID=143630 RepID=UPI0040576ED0
MNINFKAQPDLLLSSRGSVKAIGDQSSYFAGRNNPHPRSVCHIKGLNDVPVCAVRDLGYISGHLLMPRIEQSQSTVRTRTSVGPSFPSTITPEMQVFRSKRNSCPQQTSDMKDIALLPNRTRKTPVLKRKNDLLRKYIPEQSQDMPLSDARALSPTLALRYRPEVMENMNYTLTYLDHEIKILEKLRDILQTDSLTEIRDWLSKASLNDKEFVSNFIRSDITTQDLLHYQQKYGQSESETAHLNLQAILKGSKSTGTGEDKQRNIRQGSRGSIRTKSVIADDERENLLTRGEKIIIPTCDPVPLEHSPSRSKIQESRTPSRMPQDSSHMLYRKARMSQKPYIAENVPPKL